MTTEEKVGQLRPFAERIRNKEERGKRRALFIAGPTGSGKSALSLELALAIGGEIVSADSMQVYRGMDLGTAKASPEERLRIPHHMVDVCDLSDSYSVVDYYYGAQQAIEEIQGREKVPIVVGGTGFYLHSLLYGPPAGPPSVGEVRRRLETQMDRMGTDYLYEELKRLDPGYALSITPNDRHKVIRALEIMTLTGERVSELSWKGREPSFPGELSCWFFYRPRSILYERVNQRCEEMLADGFLQEVENLLGEGLLDNPSASQSIGYRQAIAYLKSPRSEEDYRSFVEEFKRASRHYVKRQLTWFRNKEPLFTWVDVERFSKQEVLNLIMKDLGG